MKLLYALSLLTAFGITGANAFLGREFFGNRKRTNMPPSVRQTPGAYRTFLHNNGFRGGK